MLGVFGVSARPDLRRQVATLAERRSYSDSVVSCNQICVDLAHPAIGVLSDV